MEATAVTKLQKKTLMHLLKRHPLVFQETLFHWVERLLTLECDDAHTRNLFRLLEQFCYEIMRSNQHVKDGPILVKSLIRQVLDLYHLPKLQ
jgi:hypothetical protein